MSEHDLKMNILDHLAAKYAQRIVPENLGQEDVKKREGLVTKTLGVLQENGVYACFLYLLVNEEKNKAKAEDSIICHMLSLIDELGLGIKIARLESGAINCNAFSVLQFVSSEITSDMERLLLVREILEQMLIYVRYGAKAVRKE